MKNKKGNSPMWLAANGGHLQVVELLFKVRADIDSQDNRKVSKSLLNYHRVEINIIEFNNNNGDFNFFYVGFMSDGSL